MDSHSGILVSASSAERPLAHSISEATRSLRECRNHDFGTAEIRRLP